MAGRGRVSVGLAAWSCGLALLVATGAQPERASSQGSAIEVTRHRPASAPEAPAGDGTITIVRVDLARYELRVLTESHDGPRRPLSTWVRDEHLAGGINAGMFLPNGRACGFLRYRDDVRSARRPGSFDGVLGFDPRGGGAALVAGGAGCSRDFAAIERDFGSVILGRKLMIDCQGRATGWSTRRFSAAAMGVDREGRAVFVHTRTAWRMAQLSTLLAAPELGIRGLVYMEGGPEASLIVDAEGQRVIEMGSWEDGFWENDGNHELWDLPNVIGFAPRR